MSDPPLVEMISEDPVLRNTKLISEAWDCDGLFQVARLRWHGHCLQRAPLCWTELCLPPVQDTCRHILRWT